MRRSILYFLSFLLVAGMAVNAEATLWDVNGHDYIVVQLPDTSWTDAISHLEANYAGYSLAVITSAEEQAFVESVLNGNNHEQKAYQGEYWLGGYQALDEYDPDAGWKWYTGGEEFNYANWYNPSPALEEPNDHYGPGSEQHLAVWSRYDWQWNDEGAIGNITGYVAESVSEPSTVMLIGFALLGMAGLSQRRFKQ